MVISREGKIFFEKPQSLYLKGDSEEMINPVTNIADGIASQVRTKSIRDQRYYDPRRNVDYALSTNPSNVEITNYMERQAIHGYGEGAIVSRRWVSPLRFLYPSQWGMIITTYKNRGFQASYFPYWVQWFDGSKSEGTWAEDLIVIHAAIDKTILIDIVEEQGQDVEEAKKSLLI